MATLYSTIYNSFLEKISDADFLLLSTANRESLMFGYMNCACIIFDRVCTFDLTDRNEVTKQFNISLTDEDIDIIATGMVVEWLAPKYYNNINFKNTLSTPDYKTYSPANLQKEIRETYFGAKNEFKVRMNEYSYMNGSMEDLSPELYAENE